MVIGILSLHRRKFLLDDKQEGERNAGKIPVYYCEFQMMKKQCWRAQLSRWYSMTGSYSASQNMILPLSSFTERWSVLKIVNLFVPKIFMTAMSYLQYILLQLSSSAISSFFLDFSK